MAPQASKKCGLLPPDHQQIGCCASNGINSETVPDTIFLFFKGGKARRHQLFAEDMDSSDFVNIQL